MSRLTSSRLKVAAVALTLAAGGAALLLPRAGSAPASAATAASATPTVSMVAAGASCSSRFCYTPATITIHQAQTINFVNDTTTVHTVTTCTASACSGVGKGTGSDPAFNSGIVAAGATYSHTFHGAGTYNYYCQIHGYAVMHGSVTVLAFAISTSALPAGKVGTAYSLQLATAGGKTPFGWVVSAGALPPGLHLGPGGKISGIPTKAGTFHVTAKATDSSTPKLTATKAFTLIISA